MMRYVICELRRCHECNQPVGSKDKYCTRCGARLPREPRGATAP